jgi:uroporphyrinogen decarboxylase
MTPTQRVLAACQFRTPDRVPRCDSFWEYPLPQNWRDALGPDANLTDIDIWVPNEGTFPLRAGVIREDGADTYRVNAWGQTIRSRKDAYFEEVLASPLKSASDIDNVQFDPPDLDQRYFQRQASLEKAAALLKSAKQKACVFGKTGGPYLRSAFIRGETDFLMDIAGDPPAARAIAERMGDHLIGIAREEIRRWALQDTGVWVYDDMAYNSGPMFSPAAFEEVFLPVYRRMVAAYKQAGARYVFLHSDGNIEPLLDMLVDAGIDGINPIEPRAGMDIVAIRRRFPQLILVGGMDNSGTLIHGPEGKIEAEARRIIDLARGGGTIIGAHSIGPDISLENFLAYHRTCLNYGRFA